MIIVQYKVKILLERKMDLQCSPVSAPSVVPPIPAVCLTMPQSQIWQILVKLVMPSRLCFCVALS